MANSAENDLWPIFPIQSGVRFYIGDVGQEVSELPNLDAVKLSDKSIGIPLSQLGKLAANAGPDSMIWVHINPERDLPPSLRLADDAIEINFGKLELKVDGEIVHFTKTQFGWLRFLAERRDLVVGRDEINEAFGWTFGTPSTVDVFIRNIRKGFGQHSWVIRTSIKSGFMLSDNEKYKPKN